MYFHHSESLDVHMRTLGNSGFLSDVSVPAAARVHTLCTALACAMHWYRKWKVQKAGVC